MPIVNRVADLQPDIQAWRRDIHENPELLYEVHRTAAFVADRLREFGCDEVATGLGKTGVVGVIKGKQPGKGEIGVIGLRADMDALPIEEATNLPHASKTPGLMHACGHDGHTAMLLGAARYLAETRNFAGDAVVIFQPAEEGGAGGLAMVKDGMMERFGIEQVYGMHNGPGIPVGSFAIRPGPIMAATDEVDIMIEGLGGHAAHAQGASAAPGAGPAALRDLGWTNHPGSPVLAFHRAASRVRHEQASGALASLAGVQSGGWHKWSGRHLARDILRLGRQPRECLCQHAGIRTWQSRRFAVRNGQSPVGR